MHDLGVLILRITVGGLLAGHGSQKLFGSFEGGGPEGTGKFMEQLGLRPGEQWALTAGAGEFTGGLLTTLGAFHPLGPILSLGPMVVAWGRAHWGKPIWVTSGGAELPLTNIAIALGLTLIGPGRLSVDNILGIRVPPAVAVLGAAGVAGGALLALSQPQPGAKAQKQETAKPGEITSA